MSDIDLALGRVVIEGGQPQDFTGSGCVRIRFRFR